MHKQRVDRNNLLSGARQDRHAQHADSPLSFLARSLRLSHLLLIVTHSAFMYIQRQQKLSVVVTVRQTVTEQDRFNPRIKHDDENI